MALLSKSSFIRARTVQHRRETALCKSELADRPGGRGRSSVLAEPSVVDSPLLSSSDRPGGRGRIADIPPSVAEPASTIALDRPGGRGRNFTPEVVYGIVSPIIVDRPGGRSNRLAFESGSGGGSGNGGDFGGWGGSGDWSRWPLFVSVYATICAGAWAIHNFNSAAPAPQPAS